MATEPHSTRSYRIKVYRGTELPFGFNKTFQLDTEDNLDVRVFLDDGTVYFSTYFTLASIQRLMLRWHDTGECNGGQYFWSTNAIISLSLTDEAIAASVADLIATGEFESAFGLTQQTAQADTDKPAVLRQLFGN